MFRDRIIHSQHDIITVLLLPQLSADSWMCLEYQGGLNPTFSPTTNEGLTFPFYKLVGLYFKFYLP